MEQPIQLLLLTREPAIQNLIEQVCHIDGHRTVTAATVDEAHALTAQGGGDAFALAVIDTAALVACDPQQADMAYQLWQEWSVAYPGLPLMFVGTQSQHDAFLSNRDDIGVFLEKPFGPRAFADTMRRCLPSP